MSSPPIFHPSPSSFQRAVQLLEWHATQSDLSPTGVSEVIDVYHSALITGLEILERRANNYVLPGNFNDKVRSNDFF